MAFVPEEKKSQEASLEINETTPEVAVETKPETSFEVEEEKREVKEEPVERPIEQPTLPPPQVVAKKDPVLQGVEDILAEDLTDIFLQLPPEKRSLFKQKGEEIAQKINVMIVTGKVTVKRILDLIREWLSMIPGVNKFFLEQESKIKTDRIVSFADSQAKLRENSI